MVMVVAVATAAPMISENGHSKIIVIIFLSENNNKTFRQSGIR